MIHRRLLGFECSFELLSVKSHGDWRRHQFGALFSVGRDTLLSACLGQNCSRSLISYRPRQNCVTERVRCLRHNVRAAPGFGGGDWVAF